MRSARAFLLLLLVLGAGWLLLPRTRAPSPLPEEAASGPAGKGGTPVLGGVTGLDSASPPGSAPAGPVRTRTAPASAPALVHGHVYGDLGPIAGAEVALFGPREPGSDPPPPLGTARSDAAGAYAIAGLSPEPLPLLELLAVAAGFQPCRLDSLQIMAAGLRIDLRLERGLAIEGFVCDPDRNPLSGLEIVAASGAEMSPSCVWQNTIERAFAQRPELWREGWREGRGTSGAGGRFRISGLGPGRWGLAIGSYEWVVAPPVAAQAGSSGLEVVVHPCLVLEGTVLDRETRQPVPRFHASVSPRSGKEGREFSSPGRQGRLRLGLKLGGFLLNTDRFQIKVWSLDHLVTTKEILWTGKNPFDLEEFLLERKPPVEEVELTTRVTYNDDTPYSSFLFIEYRKSESDPWKLATARLVEPGLYRVRIEAAKLLLRAPRCQGPGWNPSLDRFAWHGAWSPASPELGPIRFQRFSRIELRFDPGRCLASQPPLTLTVEDSRGSRHGRELGMDALLSGRAAVEDLPPGRYEFFFLKDEVKICTTGPVEVLLGVDCTFPMK